MMMDDAHEFFFDVNLNPIKIDSGTKLEENEKKLDGFKMLKWILIELFIARRATNELSINSKPDNFI